ncbi:MAG: hypothetical protein D6786_10145 [Gammaproteobacteria bacterium]|nr:MAG: hypothetical protein D6786_10145 [Gammaproteobacteria bacterium]
MIRTIFILAIGLGLAPGRAVTAGEVQPVAADDAAAYLKFETRDDNACMRLWPRGKLIIMFNTHPEKAIRYRLGRVFAGTRQPGFTTGVIEPGAEPHPLGCTLVEGRDQKWVPMQARFVDDAD